VGKSVKASASNIREQKDGVNGVNPVYFVYGLNTSAIGGNEVRDQSKRTSGRQDPPP
jgi:hypothetical protein